MQSMIVFSEISKSFKTKISAKRVHALRGLSLEIAKGEVFGFLGPNGAGKSTAIKILLNLIFPDSGSASIMGKDVGDPTIRRVVGFLPENPCFYDYLTAEELLRFGGSASGMKHSVVRERTETLLRKVNLYDARKRPLRTYSKGMVQRAGLAMALVHDPEVVVLDEPMSGLDPIGRKMVGDLILELKNEGKTVFFSSHILNDVERFCDKAGIVVGGRLRVTGKLGDLLQPGQTLEDRFLLEVEKAGHKEAM